MAIIEQQIRYASPSQLRSIPGGADLRLAAAQGDTSCFFDGELCYPALSAACLRSVSDLVGTRFYVPPSMLARILREADPVATVARDNLRFEGFSACCSTYIRHDISADAFVADVANSGTVNVDFRDDMRAALANIGNDQKLHLTISANAVSVDLNGESVVEKKVPLPLRWMKGFAEVQIHQAGMRHAVRLDKVAAQRFLRSLPRGKSDQPQWMVVHGRTVRLSACEVVDSVRIKGSQRLRNLERLSNSANHMDIYFNEQLGSSAWVLEFGAQRLTLVINSEPWRGFSGDGQLLSDLASEVDEGTAKIRAHLHWQSNLRSSSVAEVCGVSLEQAEKGLARLAASGLLGFDLKEHAYFHRVLPFSLNKIETLNPRLKSARALVDAGAVKLMPDGGADIMSGDIVHRVRQTQQGFTCTCPWFAKNEAERGPCKHMLAAEIQMETENG
ncbi:MAG: SWIM zinc finger family protein [Hyphomicrobiales bacterium]|nr:SWIM zinc finger family protein [Hyphomicrobiales bacterium]